MKKQVPTTPISKSKKTVSGLKSGNINNSNNAPTVATAITIQNDIALNLPLFRDVSSKDEKLMKVTSDIKDLKWDGTGGYESCLEHLTRVSKLVARANFSEQETLLGLSLNLSKNALKLFIKK